MREEEGKSCMRVSESVASIHKSFNCCFGSLLIVTLDQATLYIHKWFYSM